MVVGGGITDVFLIPLESFDRAGMGFVAIQMRIWMVLAIVACWYVIWTVKSNYLKASNAFPVPYSPFILILLISILYAKWVYPFMPFALGGGTPTIIKFVIDQEKVDNLNQIIPVEFGNITNTLYLIDQSELSYFVLVPKDSEQKVVYPIEIKKDLVLSTVHEKDVIFPFLGNIELMPKITPSPSSTSTP
jgi:hypothetical protein